MIEFGMPRLQSMEQWWWMCVTHQNGLECAMMFNKHKKGVDATK
jgi:hypothetical protein